MTRREFLRWSAWLAGATIFVACAPASPATPSLVTPSPTLANTPSPTLANTPSPTRPPVSATSSILNLRVFTAGYPRAYFFRSAEGLAANERITYDDWERTFNRLMGIEGKALDEEVPGRGKRNGEFFSRFKQQHPDQLVLLHLNGSARDPRVGERFFAGHWLYFNGACIVSDVLATYDETEIHVSNASLFRTNIGRYRNANEDIGLCELDAQGKPNWHASEQVELIAVDTRRNTIRVKRGAFGTTPRAFAANRAYAAAHCTEGPWGKNSRLIWLYNYALTCPRDANGKTCADVLVDDLAEKLLPGGALEQFDGIEFDVLWHVLGNPDARGRAADADADGIADSGIVGGDNVYGRGVIEFCRQLRARLGDARLILADGQIARNQRAFGILNGIEAEGWPHLRDPRVDDWSGGLNRQAFWVANARAPKFSYINHKFQKDDGDFDSHASFPYATHRLVFAGAVFTDSAICYSLLPPTEKDELVGIWDELWMGQERRLGWLGQPLAPAVHLAEKQNNLLARWTLTDLRAHLRGEVDVERENDALRITARGTNALRFAITLPANGTDLLIVFTARAVGDIARLVQIHFGTDEPSAFWVNQHAFKFYHYRGDVRANPVELNFEVEGNAPFWLERVAAYAFPDAMYREFEHGLVLANPSLHPFTFDLPVLFPNQSWRRLRGSPQQDPRTNDGSRVQGALTLPARDALFLARA